MRDKVIYCIGAHEGISNGSSRSFFKLVSGLMLYQEHDVLINTSAKADIFKLEMSPNYHGRSFAGLRRSVSSILKCALSFCHFILILKNLSTKYANVTCFINDIPWAYLLIAKLIYPQVKFIIYVRYPENNKIVRFVLCRILSLSDLVLHVSSNNKNLWGLRHGKVLWNPGKHELISENKIITRPKKYLIISRMSPEKGVIEAVEFWTSLPANMRANTQLTIVGDAIYDYQKTYLEGIRAKYGDEEGLQFCGELDDVENVLSTHQVFVHTPNFEDPFPGTILEALAKNLIIVTNFKGGIAEQCDGFTGVYSMKEFCSVEFPLNIDRREAYTKKFLTNEIHVNKLIELVTKI